MLDKLFLRRDLGLASARQVLWLRKLGHPTPELATFEEAKQFLDAKWGKAGGRGMRRYRSVGLRPPLPRGRSTTSPTARDEGRRNAELFDAACQFRDAGIARGGSRDAAHRAGHARRA